MSTIFITGIGTGVGKTVVAAIITEALGAAYWKPVQAGYTEGTDSEWVKSVLTNPACKVLPEAYRLKLAASPHIAAGEEGVEIDMHVIRDRVKELESGVGSAESGVSTQPSPDSRLPTPHSRLPTPDSRLPTPDSRLVIEGAGGLLVPLNDKEFMADLIHLLQSKVVLVSRNYLGSINHSLLTAEVCRQYKLDVLGWVFNDRYMAYEDEIVHWTGYPRIASIPMVANPDAAFIAGQAILVRQSLSRLL